MMENEPQPTPADTQAAPESVAAPVTSQYPAFMNWLLGGLLVVIVCCMCGALAAVGGGSSRPAQPAAQGVQAQESAPAFEPAATTRPPTRAAQPPSPAAAQEDDSDRYPLSSPAPLGTAVDLPVFRLTVLTYERPVDNYLKDRSLLNKAEEGMEFGRVQVRVTCQADEECSFWPDNFQLLGESDIYYNRVWVLFDTPSMLEGTDMRPGATLEGWLYYMVPKGEGMRVLRWAPWVGEEVYFAIR